LGDILPGVLSDVVAPLCFLIKSVAVLFIVLALRGAYPSIMTDEILELVVFPDPPRPAKPFDSSLVSAVLALDRLNTPHPLNLSTNPL